MTLLELLVKELSGAWPVEAHGVVQDSTGQIWFFKNGTPYFTGSIWGADKESKNFDWVQWDLRLDLAVDNNFSIVTREQYEAAIASQQPVWNGEGLPPVGCECEYQDIDGWVKTKILCVDGDIIFHKRNCSYSFDSSCFFRSIRTESDRKRDLAVGAMERSWESVTGVPAYDFEKIYDAIVAGKIPGVELSK